MPYVNGELFAERLGFAEFNRDMRNALLACTRFDWSRISPAVFGSLFQAVMEPKERRQIGGHYTSERDILRVIRSLFLDDLRAEFRRVRRNKTELKRFHKRLGQLRFLDPACGCGNFLVVTYRELRLLEIEILQELFDNGQRVLDIQHVSVVDVDAMYGIEIHEWPVRIAEAALWLMDHQMNLRLSAAFGQYFVRLPLQKSPRIVQGNALRLDWKELLPPGQCSYILGNPPFVGAKYQTAEQRADMDLVAGHVRNSGLLDYVTGWYFKAADYIRDTRVVVGFVSTNSITQGEQVAVLWGELFRNYGVTIHFGHRTFAWESEARGKAHVHVVIVGFAAFDTSGKKIFDYESAETVSETKARNISPYLIEGSNQVVANRQTPLCDVPAIGIGNKPIDDGNYLFTPAEKEAFLASEPEAAPLFRRWVGSKEFINGIERWCLWLGDCPPHQLRQLPRSPQTRGRRPPLPRGQQERSDPKAGGNADSVSRREHARRAVSADPQGFVRTPQVHPHRLHGARRAGQRSLFPDARCARSTTSASCRPPCTWPGCGRCAGGLNPDIAIPPTSSTTTFPWPDAPSEKRRAAVEAAAAKVLAVRAEYPESTLADLYDPLAMPAKLVKAHAALDRAVDRCYRTQPFASDRQRVEFLFALYEELSRSSAPIVLTSPRSRRLAGSSWWNVRVSSRWASPEQRVALARPLATRLRWFHSTSGERCRVRPAGRAGHRW